ncbi:hypothetical protein ASPWEDRAFT_741461 [Aspergillus wentii DTO 134E9]|uniref:NADP-dependent oxidoreductase domain-containing protein n=1 Tax=Aspergillus wentii DTO 134E9 TaxID=1073089 RepID=A0A1L9RMU5_ASPWE|nr:uncharacterized protein ASPWEDRAFT_741461 [Aspergillus wentii DTO 134E9]OJJ36232.1 hypothetical protein ASPWEDRAFT_741461 [Aspergillus wentii DTO 134E9]
MHRCHGARITSPDEFNQCLDLFQEKGYCEIDTARVYDAGRQEAFTREAHWKERGLPIATKWYPLGAGSHRAKMLKEKLEGSLRELGTDCLDVFYLHDFQTLDELYRQGKFKQLGLSNFSAYEVAEIGSSGKYKSTDEPTDGRFSEKSSYQGKTYRWRYFKPSVCRALEVALEVPEPVVEKYGLTLVEVALRWCVRHSGLNIVRGKDGVVTGFSSLGQLQGNLADLEKGPLPAEVVDALDQAWLITEADSSTFWHGELKYAYDTEDALFGKKDSK